MTRSLQAQVLVVGCGPIGLWLAFELRKANVDVLVIDAIPSRKQREDFPKSLSISAGSLDYLTSMGVAKLFIDRGIPLPVNQFGFLGPVPLGYEVLGVPHSCFLLLEQHVTEDILLDMCLQAGVRFAWSTRFVSLQQDENGVDANVAVLQDDGSKVSTTIRARYLVGCDGLRSAVRASAGFEVEHTPSTHRFFLSHPRLAEEPQKKGFHTKVLPGRCTLMAPTPRGRWHIVASAPSLEDDNLSEEAMIESIKETMRLAFGSDYGLYSPQYTSSFTDATRHVNSYQMGRVFLCGDASHQFPPAGGQGMNAGFGDASNLAWKLCAALLGKESQATIDHLLGTYTTERHAAVEAVLQNVQVQMHLISAKTAEDFAVRNFVAGMMKNPWLNQNLARDAQSLGGPTAAFAPYCTDVQDAELHGAPSLVGSRFTHLRLKPAGHVEGEPNHNLGTHDLSRFVLLVRADQPPAKDESRVAALRQVLNGYQDRVTLLQEETVANHAKWDGVYAFLMRPDRHIAWAARGRESSEETAMTLQAAMEYWWGSPK